MKNEVTRENKKIPAFAAGINKALDSSTSAHLHSLRR